MELEDRIGWDDVRVFLAMAQSGSIRAAANHLGLSHPTVRRRLDELEVTIGQKLFVRRPDGLHATPQGEEFLDAAHEVERAMQKLARRTRAADPNVHGSIRVSLTGIFGSLLAKDLAAFQEKWPGVELDLTTAGGFADLGRMDADVAIRLLFLGRSPNVRSAGEPVVTGSQAAYGDLKTKRWIGSQRKLAQAEWAARSPFPDFPVRSIIGSPLVRRDACLAGMGLAMLPCLVGDPALPRLSDPVSDFNVWVLVHPDLRQNPRIRLFREAMVRALEALGPRFRGEQPRRRRPRRT